MGQRVAHDLYLKTIESCTVKSALLAILVQVHGDLGHPSASYDTQTLMKRV